MSNADKFEVVFLCVLTIGGCCGFAILVATLYRWFLTS